MRQNKEKKFDCLKMKDQIQANVYAETKHMTKEDLLRYFNGNIKQPDPKKQTVHHA